MKGRCGDSVIKKCKESTNYERYHENRHEEPVDTETARFHSSELVALDHPTEHKKDSYKCRNGYDLHNSTGCLEDHNFNSGYISDIIIELLNVLIQQTHDNNQGNKKQKPDEKGFKVFTK